MRTFPKISVPFREEPIPVSVPFREEPAPILVSANFGFLAASDDEVNKGVIHMSAPRSLMQADVMLGVAGHVDMRSTRIPQSISGTPTITAGASMVSGRASSQAFAGRNDATLGMVSGRASSQAAGTPLAVATVSLSSGKAGSSASAITRITGSVSTAARGAQSAAAATTILTGSVSMAAGKASSQAQLSGSAAVVQLVAPRAGSSASANTTITGSASSVTGRASSAASGTPIADASLSTVSPRARMNIGGGTLTISAANTAGKASSVAAGTPLITASANNTARGSQSSATVNTEILAEVSLVAGGASMSSVGGTATATVDQVAGRASSSASVITEVTSSVSMTAGGAKSEASSISEVSGTVSMVAGKASTAVVGTGGIAGTSAIVAGKASSQASGSPVAGISSGISAGPSYSAASGYTTVTAQAANVAGKASSSAQGANSITLGIVAGKASQSITAMPKITASLDQVAGKASMSSSGMISNLATVAHAAGKAGMSASGTPQITASVTQYARGVTQSSSVMTSVPATVSMVPGGASMSASGKTTVTGSVSKAAGKASSSASGNTTVQATSSMTTGKASQSISGSTGGSSLSPPFVVGTAPFVSGTGSISPTFAASGRIKDDLLLLAIESANQTIATPSGWTQVANSPQSTGTAAAAGGVRLAVFYKVSSGTETTVSVADSGDHTTAAGIVVRGADTAVITNMLQNSNNLTNTTYWSVFNGGSVATGTILGPDGSTYGTRLQITSGGTDQANVGGVYTEKITGATAGMTITVSFWARGTSASRTFSINVYTQGSVNGDLDTLSGDFTATTTWQRFSFTTTLQAGLTYINMGIAPASDLSGTDIQVWGVQMEQGSTANTYVATTSAALAYLPAITVTAGKVQTPATTSVSFSSITTADDNSLVVNFFGNDRDATASNSLSSAANSSLVSLTTHIDSTTASGVGGGLAILSGVMATAGSVSATTATNAASVTNASITLALKPKPASTSTVWTPSNLSTAPLVVVDPQNISWNGSAFSQLINTGSAGGTFITAFGSPAQSAGTVNGYDAITFAANSAIYIPSLSLPSGNLFIFYVSKKLGSPATFGVVAAQAYSTPGFVLADEAVTGTTFSTGDVAVAGDKALFAWPAGGSAITNADVIVHPATDDGAYHMTAAKLGTEVVWRQDGTSLTPTYYTTHSLEAKSSNFLVGSDGYNSLHWNGALAYLCVLQDPTSDEVQKLEGWAAWKYGLVSLLPNSHPYKYYAPSTNGDPARGGWNTTALDASVMTFSNDNRTVVGHDPTGGSHNAVRSLAGASSGKIFVSVAIDVHEYMDVSLTDAVDHYYVHYAYDGTIWTSAGGGAVLATLSAYTAPCVIDMAADLDANLIWFRLNGGNWNGSSSNDPSAGTGGYALPRDGTNPVYAKAQILYYADGQRTLNTGTVAFTYAPPSGFSALKS